MKKVLIISYVFQKKEVVGAIRLRGLAKYLRKHGWDATILSGTEGEDEEFDVKSILADDVLVQWKKKIGLPLDKNLKTQFEISEKENSYRFLDTIIRCWETIFGYPDLNRTWIKPAIIGGREILHSQSFDAIISSSPPPSVHLVAAQLASEYRIPWIADFRDLWTQNQYHRSSIRNFFEERLERNTLTGAAALVTVSDPLKKKLQSFHTHKRIIAIPNGFDPIQINQGYSLTKKLTITYTGTIYRNFQDPVPLFTQLRGLIDERIVNPECIEILFFGRDNVWLIPYIHKYHLQDCVQLHGMISREESIQKQRESQILLFLDWNDPEEEGIYTGKIFDYLAARRPIISMGTNNRGVVKILLERTRAGVHISSEESLRAYLIGAFHEYTKTGYIQYSGIFEEIIKYSHLEMADRYASLLEEISKTS